MKLLIVSSTYWPQGTGGSLATHLVVKLLSKCENSWLSVLAGTKNPETMRRSIAIITSTGKGMGNVRKYDVTCISYF